MPTLTPDQTTCARNVQAKFPDATPAWIAHYTGFDRGAVERAVGCVREGA